MKPLAVALALCALFASDAVETARQMMRDGQFGAARAELTRVVATAPENLEARKLLAKVCLLADCPLVAERQLQAVTTSSPGDAEAWSLLGRLLESSGRPVDAQAPLRRALSLAASDILARVALANSLYAAGQTDEARRQFSEAVQRNSTAARPSAAAHAAYAIFLLRLNQPAEATKQLALALAIDAEDTLAREAARALRVRQSQDQDSSGDTRVIQPSFENIARQAGLLFQVENSATPLKHQIETMPGGVAVLDFDGDGWMDIYFTNGAESPSLRKSGPRFWNRLYRNNGNLTFTDVTAKAGVAGSGYTMGVAAGDFDNDGLPDLFVVGVDRSLLYHNNGDGTFTDVAPQAGFNKAHAKFGRRWAIHAAWLDYDRDGWLDLFVANYSRWDPATEHECRDERPASRSYCHPKFYDPLPNQLFHNNGDGTFTDVSVKAGIDQHLGKGMGVAVADIDQDGWPDIFVANDTEPNFLFRNRGDGTFEEAGLASGVALNQFGKALSSMGADLRDLDNDGWPDLFVTTLSNEGFLLFKNRAGQFEDVSDAARLTAASLPYSGWSNVIADFNNDGWKDLFSANGHALDNIELMQNREYRQPNLLLMQVAPLRFVPATKDVPQIRAAHRGAAVADFDNDGRLDLVVTALNGPTELWHNTTPHLGGWLTVRLEGKRSTRDAEGAVLTLVLDDGRQLTNSVSASAGYSSSSDRRVHFGLGLAGIRELRIRWPSGTQQTLSPISPNKMLIVREAP